VSIVNVRHIDKNTVRVEPERGYNVTVFKGEDDLEVLVSDGVDTVRIRLMPPRPDQEIVIRSRDSYALEIVYATKGPDGTLI
jgi:hypothetical protein